MAKQKTYYRHLSGKVASFRSRKSLDVLKKEVDYEVYVTRQEANEALGIKSPKPVKKVKKAGVVRKTGATRDAIKKEVKKEDELQYLITSSVISVTYKGEKQQVQRSQRAYEIVFDILKEGSLDTLKEVFDKKKSLLELGLEVAGGKVTARNVVIPPGLVSKFEDLADSGKKGRMAAKLFFDKVNKNPKPQILEELVEFLKHNNMLFTEDGNIIGYKAVRANFKDLYSGRMDNSPGKVVSMPREEVNNNPHVTCSHGLHVGSYAYASNFGGGKVVEVLVDPRDVVSVPHDYDGQKMRCCKYKILKQISNPRHIKSCVVRA